MIVAKVCSNFMGRRATQLEKQMADLKKQLENQPKEIIKTLTNNSGRATSQRLDF